MTGFVAWEGASLFDGTPIGVVVSHLDHDPLNRKLGSMAQAWILPRDTAPTDAVVSGVDGAVCGDCQFRPVNGGGCYVPIAQAPQRVWYAWRHLGTYAETGWAVPDALLERALRIGAWGDPAAVPVWVWHRLLEVLPRWTAYTEQWRNLPAADWAWWCMASVKSSAERAEARALGWRTFRVRLHGDPLEAGERVCPAADESPTREKATCERCHLCDGLRGRPVPDVTLFVHGQKIRRATETLAAFGGQVDELAARQVRHVRHALPKYTRSGSMGSSRGQVLRESPLKAARKSMLIHHLRTRVTRGGLSGRELMDELPRMARMGYQQVIVLLNELETSGMVYRTGDRRTQRWFPFDPTVRDHLLFLLSDGKPWYRLDLVESCLYERELEVEDQVTGLVLARKIAILPDGRYTVATSVAAPAEPVHA